MSHFAAHHSHGTWPFDLPSFVFLALQVHVRTWKCASVSCNCGIAAREGDDIIVVDMCRDRIPRARFASRAEPADGTSIRRDNNGKSFIVSFIIFCFSHTSNNSKYLMKVP